MWVRPEISQTGIVRSGTRVYKACAFPPELFCRSESRDSTSFRKPSPPMSHREIAVIVSSFERPRHLQRCLWSLMLQQGMEGRMEVVVADDGSSDETLDVIKTYSSNTPFPLSFTTHEHNGFQLARTRNEGVLASSAPYLLFVDCDCILPPDHLQHHLEAARPNTVIAGDCIRLDENTTAAIDECFIQNRKYENLASRAERRRIFFKALKDQIYGRLPLSNRPRLTGNNIGIARSDFDRVNGFDENYIGWGLEDSDLQRRLALAGVSFRSILNRTVTYHLWHEPAASFSRNNQKTRNLEYFQRKLTSPVCERGLSHRMICEFESSTFESVSVAQAESTAVSSGG